MGRRLVDSDVACECCGLALRSMTRTAVLINSNYHLLQKEGVDFSLSPPLDLAVKMLPFSTTLRLCSLPDSHIFISIFFPFVSFVFLVLILSPWFACAPHSACPAAGGGGGGAGGRCLDLTTE